MTFLYHNPKCSKSRIAYQFLEKKQIKFETVLYLEKGLTQKEIIEILDYLHVKPIEIVRTKEDIWQEKYTNQILKDEDIIDALIQHPKLLERPIFKSHKNAVIARSLEKLDNFLKLYF